MSVLVFTFCAMAAFSSPQMVGLDLRHALEIFEDLLHQAFVGVDLLPGHLSGSFLQSRVLTQEQRESGREDQSDPPVEEEEHHNDERGGQKSLADQHHHAGRHVFEVLHHVGCDGGDLPEAVFVEISHGQIPHVLRDLDPLSRAGVVSRLGLEHGGLRLDQSRADHAEQHDPEGEKNVPRFHGSREKRLHHDGDGGDLQGAEEGFDHPEPDGGDEFLPVFLPAEGKEFSDGLKHGPSPPCAPPTCPRRGRGGRAVPRGCRSRRSLRPSRRRSDPRR